MDKDISSLDQKHQHPHSGAESSTSSADPPMAKNTDGHSGSKHWEVLLSELVHLIGLFITHSKKAESVRTTEVLFSQLVSHIAILKKIPNHDGGILIRRTHCKTPFRPLDADYVAICGDMMVKVSGDKAQSRQTTHLRSALTQAFECFAEHGIHSLFLKLIGDTARETDQLQLAMNIVARYKYAVKDSSSIRFRCYGRALTFPVIHDAKGQPDLNLTLIAALNGLSPINARELIKQAAAYHTLNMFEGNDAEPSNAISNYNQIFATRSLRSQITKPPIEVNNLPWLIVDQLPVDNSCRDNLPTDQKKPEEKSPSSNVEQAVPGLSKKKNIADDRAPNDQKLRTLVSKYIDIDDQKYRKGYEALTKNDYAALVPFSIGERLVAVTQFLYALEKNCQDPAVIEQLIDLFQRRLKHVRDETLSNIIARRQGLKILSEGRTVVVGMVHPRLFDLITLVSEHVVAVRRMEIIQKIAFNFDACHMISLADGFGISVSDAHHILGILQGCFNSHGSFVRPTFEGRISVMAQYENVIFEILWCFLKETPRREDRLNFLNALQLLMDKLNNPKRATQFLLSDICQNPAQIAFTDRNAFSLANILLHQENRELYIDINRTPEDVLDINRRINKEVRNYICWRLEVDRVRIITKLKTIHQEFERALRAPGGEKRSFETSFLMALEREGIIFLAIAGGHTARIYLRQILGKYGNPDSEIYRDASQMKLLAEMMDHLQIILRALGRAGNSADTEQLKAMQGYEQDFRNLDPHPAHALRVKQSMKWASEAIKTIHSRG